MVIDGKLEAPSGFAIGPDGDLYVAERLEQRVRRFSIQGEEQGDVHRSAFRTCRSSSSMFPEKFQSALSHCFPAESLIASDGRLCC